MSTGKMFKITYFHKKAHISFLWGATETGSWGEKPLQLESQAMPLSLPPDKWEVIQETQPDQASSFQLQILFHECVAPMRYNGVFWFTPTQWACLPPVGKCRMPGFLWFCGFKQKTKIQPPLSLAPAHIPLPTPTIYCSWQWNHWYLWTCFSLP